METLTFAKKLKILNILKEMKENMSSPKFSLELDESTGETYITAKYKNYTLSNLGEYALFINGKYILDSDLFIAEEAREIADEILHNKVTKNVERIVGHFYEQEQKEEIISILKMLKEQDQEEYEQDQDEEEQQEKDMFNVVVFPKAYNYSYCESTDTSNVIPFPVAATSINNSMDTEEDDGLICF